MFQKLKESAAELLRGKRIGILMGGYSSEREISLKSGEAVLHALLQAGYDATGFDIDKRKIDMESLLKMDVLFPLLHGRGGEDGAIQGVLEWLDLPYVGSGVQGSAFALNKYVTKVLAEKRGVLTARYALNERGDISLPLVVKGVNEGSSLGMAICKTEEEYRNAMQELRRCGDLLVEEFIEGRQVTVGLVAGIPLAVIEICPEGGMYDFEHKYTPGLTRYHCPAELSEECAGELQKAALATAKVCGCRDLSRVDFILDKEERPFLLEINTIPGFTSTSLLPKAAKVAGLEFSELVLVLLAQAFQKGEARC